MKFLKKVFILMFLSYSTLLSCNNDSSKSDEKENSKLINGRLIYKAIVFGFGDVANEINEIKDNVHFEKIFITNTSEFNEKCLEKEESILSTYPNFFADIEIAVRDKNIYALDDLIYKSKQFFITKNSDYNSSNGICKVNYIYTGIDCFTGMKIYTNDLGVREYGDNYLTEIILTRWNLLNNSEEEAINSLRYEKILSEIVEKYY